MSNQFIATLPQWQMLQPFARRGVYLSGPISADPDTAPERFQQASDFMQEVFGGLLVVTTPIGIELQPGSVPGAISNRSAFVHPLYMAECYARAMHCSCIALLPGWHRSKGAVYEARFAESLGFAPLFLRSSPAGDGLFLDLSETFRVLLRAEWVDFAIAETEFGFVGDFEPGLGHAQELIPAGEDHYGNSAVNPVPIGDDPNPFNAAVDNATAQAMHDRAAMAANTLHGLGGQTFP